MRSTSILWCLVIPAVLSLAGGCSKSMVARDVHVSLDRSLRDADGKLRSVQVDVIAVPKGEVNNWTSVPVDQYWTPTAGSGLYNSPDKKTLTFSFQENVDSKVVRADDPVWGKWLGRTPSHLILIARGAGSGTGGSDPRRLVIPLDPKEWDSHTGTIEVQASTAGLQLKSPMKQQR